MIRSPCNELAVTLKDIAKTIRKEKKDSHQKERKKNPLFESNVISMLEIQNNLVSNEKEKITYAQKAIFIGRTFCIVSFLITKKYLS